MKTRSLGVACCSVLAAYSLAAASCQTRGPSNALGAKGAEGAKPPAAPAPPPPAPLMPVSQAASAQPPAPTPPVPTAPATPAFQDDLEHCPPGMAFVSLNDYCPEIERKCLHEEPIYNQHITICHRFEEGSNKCLAPLEERHFCIDRYEYPNVEGGHPTWFVTWYDGEATCESKGKRLCYESEWIAACEGPQHLPFPYGWERDNTACNIDNEYLIVDLQKMVSKNKAVQFKELERLDQGVPSGFMKRCVSGFGVHDLPGNFDEWVTRDRGGYYRGPTDISKWSGLKGGAWGHVRSACRPMTVGHDPGFAYYFIAFRCCSDAKGYPKWVPPNYMKPPYVGPADKAPQPKDVHGPGPSTTKVPQDRYY